MVLVCWAGSNVTGFIKALKFLELVASNVLAITNLAICTNLALVIMSHRTLARVKSFSSPSFVFLCLAVSIAAAVAAAPFWQTTVVSGTGFAVRNEDQAGDWLTVSRFFLEFLVGICMFVIVAWLLLFRMNEVKECWKVHARIRYYFGLTLIGTTVNLALGVCGTIYVVGGREKSLLIVLTWTFRHIHIALDTIVLYGVLGLPAATGHDEGPDAQRRSPAAAAAPGSNPRSCSSCSRPGLNYGASPNIGELSKASSWKGRASCSSSGSSAQKVQVRPADSGTKRLGQLGLPTMAKV
ncbi:unnamed protein product [Ectocarpus sp. CCAP 1310/34]|nr:unnamed protein product [Ectocarpus sp. CCAP 1310/34]